MPWQTAKSVGKFNSGVAAPSGITYLTHPPGETFHPPLKILEFNWPWWLPPSACSASAAWR